MVKVNLIYYYLNDINNEINVRDLSNKDVESNYYSQRIFFIYEDILEALEALRLPEVIAS